MTFGEKKESGGWELWMTSVYEAAEAGEAATVGIHPPATDHRFLRKLYIFSLFVFSLFAKSLSIPPVFSQRLTVVYATLEGGEGRGRDCFRATAVGILGIVVE